MGFLLLLLLQLFFSYSWPMVWFCNSRVVLCSSKSEIATEGKHQSKSLPTCYGIDDLGEGLKWRTLISFKNLFGFLPPKIYILPVPWQILCSLKNEAIFRRHTNETALNFLLILSAAGGKQIRKRHLYGGSSFRTHFNNSTFNDRETFTSLSWGLVLKT